MRSISHPMSNCSRSGRGQGHATHFYILDLENFAKANAPCGLRAVMQHWFYFFYFGTIDIVYLSYISYASQLSFFLHFSPTYLLPYLSFPLRIDPLRFQAGCRKRRLNLALVFTAQVRNKSKLWSWRVTVGQCVINMCSQPWRDRVAFVVL